MDFCDISDVSLILYVNIVILQVLTKLTLAELKATVPATVIQPKAMVLKPGQTFFLAGLGRLDYMQVWNLQTQNVFLQSSSMHSWKSFLPKILNCSYLCLHLWLVMYATIEMIQSKSDTHKFCSMANYHRWMVASVFLNLNICDRMLYMFLFPTQRLKDATSQITLAHVCRCGNQESTPPLSIIWKPGSSNISHNSFFFPLCHPSILLGSYLFSVFLSPCLE